MTFQERILSSASRHTQLVQSLGGTAYGPTAAKQNAAFIADLETRIPAETKRVEKLHWRVMKARAEFEMYRDNYLKRLAYKLQGRQDEYATITSAEEHKYHDSLAVQAQAQAQLARTEAQLADAQDQQPELHHAATNHALWRAELLALHAAVFALPHAPIPAETLALTALRRAHLALAAAHAPFALESQTTAMLADAHKYLTWALHNVRGAVKSAAATAATDPLGLGTGIQSARAPLGLRPLELEHAAMAQARGRATQAEMLMDSAVRLRPGVVRAMQPIGLTQQQQQQEQEEEEGEGEGEGEGEEEGYRGVSSGGGGNGGKRKKNAGASTVFQFRQRMVVAEKDLERAQAEVGSELEAARERVRGLKEEVDEAESEVEEAEEGLREARADIWRRALDGEEFLDGGPEDDAIDGDLDAPPEYVP